MTHTIDPNAERGNENLPAVNDLPEMQQPDVSFESIEVANKRTYSKSYDAIYAALGFHNNEDYSHTWISFRDALIEDEAFDHLRDVKTFKWAMFLVNSIVETLIIKVNTAMDSARQGAYFDLIGTLLGEQESDIQAIKMLLSSVDRIMPNARRWDLKFEDINDLRTDLSIIAHCQRLSLDARQREERARQQR